MVNNLTKKELILEIMGNYEHIEELNTLYGVSYKDSVVEEMLAEAIDRAEEVKENLSLEVF